MSRKIVIIGLGYLMEYIEPCYRAFVGEEKIAEQIYATKASNRDIESKRERLGFPISVGNNQKILKECEPEIILFATQPGVAMETATHDIAPYYDELRRMGKPLPDFYAFTPKPVGKEYAEVLGEDVAIANIIPNMFAYQGDKNIAAEGRTIVALANDGRNWTDYKRERIQRFFDVLGPVVFLKPEQQQPVLASFSSSRTITDACFEIAEKLNCKIEDVANCARAVFAKISGFSAPKTDGTCCSFNENALQGKANTICNEVVKAWKSGIERGMLEQGIPLELISNTMYPLFDLRLHIMELTDKKSIEKDMLNHATRGGVFERACIYYTQNIAPVLKTFINSNCSDKEDFYSKLEQQTYDLYIDVISHQKKLDRTVELQELRPEHHAVLFGFLAKRCIQTWGEEGKKAVLDCASIYGKGRGERMAKRCANNGEPLNMYNYLAYGEWRAKPGEANVQLVRYNPEYTTHSLMCPWCEGWKKYDLLEYGSLYCLAVDHGVVYGFNSKLHIEINALQSRGDEFCEFVWCGSNIKNDEERTENAAKKKSLTAACSKDFRYHTGHLYSVFLKNLSERYGEEGIEVCNAALFDYRRTYGTAFDFQTDGDYESV